MIYLDYSANTPADNDVLKVFVETERQFMGNPNSNHPAGLSARKELENVTNSVSGALGVLPSEIIYTSSASEANNLAIKGVAQASRPLGRHIISTPLEHPSVSGPLTYLQKQGYEIDFAEIGRDGKIDLHDLKRLLRNDTVLVAVSAVDSELGVIQPIEQITKIVKNYPNCRLHVDATQAIGKIHLSFEGIDTASLTAHKFYGLNGIGLLYKKNNLVIDPIIHGGTGASLYRSGTPTLALAASLDKALRISLNEFSNRQEHIIKLNDHLRERLQTYHALEINSPFDAVPDILNIGIRGVKGTRFQQELAKYGVCVSVKSACSTDGAPSRAVYAVSRDKRRALSSWRISLSHLTTESEIEEFLKIFDKCYCEMLL